MSRGQSGVGTPEHASRHATWPRDTCTALPQLITCPAEIDRAEEKLQYRGTVSRGPQRRPRHNNLAQNIFEPIVKYFFSAGALAETSGHWRCRVNDPHCAGVLMHILIITNVDVDVGQNSTNTNNRAS